MAVTSDEELEKEQAALLASGLLEDSLAEYINQIAKYDTLPNDVQLELLKEYREEGNIESYHKLINHNLKLAVYIINGYTGNCRTMSILDLIQEANIVIMRVLNSFDPTVGTNLSTYLSDCIKKVVQRRIDEEDRIIREPVYHRLLSRNLERFKRDFYLKNQRIPTEKEIMEGLNIKAETLKTLLVSDLLNPASLNKEIDNDEDRKSEIQEFIAYDDPNFEKVETDFDSRLILLAAKEILTKQEYYIVFNRKVIPHKRRLIQIGEEFGVTREAIRLVEKRALEKLKRVEKHRDRLIDKYTMEEIKKKRVTPLTPREISFYRNLKDNLDWLTYYFIYTKRENNYNFYDYKRKFVELTDKEIKEYIDFGSSLEQELFTEEKIEKVFNETTKQKRISQIFNFNIEPEIKKISKSTKKKINTKDLI